MRSGKSKTTGKDLFSKINSFLNKNGNIVFWSTFAISIFTSLMVFNLRISEGGDDSTYIIRAYNFIKEGTYPSFQGPLYPMFLSLIIAVSGIRLGLLKLTSLVFMAIFFYLFHKAFKNRIEPVVLYPVLLLLSVNYYVLYFSSQTYSEAMFMALLGWFFVAFFDFLDRQKTGDTNIKRTALLIFILVLLTLTRTIGAGIIIAVIIFFLAEKNYKQAVFFILAFTLMMGAWLLLKGAIWGFSSGTTSQVTTLLYKHPYDFSQGRETFSGYIWRFIDNSNLYLSKHFLIMTGLRKAGTISVNFIYTLIIYSLFIYAFVVTYKKNRYLKFTGIFLIVLLGITFVSLQRIWDQFRLIVPYFPFMLIFIILSLTLLFRIKIFTRYQILFPIILFLSTVLTIEQTGAKADLMTLRSNLMGDRFKGYTEDWMNYLKMAEYVGKKLDKNSYVACRKPNMARIYANGKKFYGIYRIDTDDPDVLLQRLRDKHVNFVIMASLRKNPALNTGMTINTIKRYLTIIDQKYPDIFIPVHQIGNSEPAFLIYIDYSKLSQ